MNDSAKVCVKCGIEKSLDDFYRKSSTRDGRQSWCKTCMAERNKVWRADNADAISESQKAWRLANPEKWQAANRAWYVANKDQKKGRRLERVYRMTLTEYQALLAEQGGICANPGCRNDAQTFGRWLNVDHDRKCCPGDGSCGECVRGLLCQFCNLILGQAEDDPVKLLGLVDYLKAWKKRKEVAS